jgi:hypothetical protein
MSETEAATLPSGRFHARLNQLPSQPARLIGIVRSAILFITWVMDALERRMNPGKPYLFEDELEDDFGVLLDCSSRRWKRPATPRRCSPGSTRRSSACAPVTPPIAIRPS